LPDFWVRAKHSNLKMQFEDKGIIISNQKFSDSGILLTIFSENHGVIKGLCKGQKKNITNSQIGNLVSFSKQSRLEEHLGKINISLERAYSLVYFSDYLKILAISSACSLSHSILQEKEVMNELYQDFIFYLENLKFKNWLKYYSLFELDLLTKTGFGFDFTRCSVSEVLNDTYYISPKTGSVVGKQVGEPYKEKLFQIPEFLKTREKEPNQHEILNAIEITRYFINKNYFAEGLAKFPQNAINFHSEISNLNHARTEARI